MDAVETGPDTEQDALRVFVLRMGDNALILGQRLSEWCGHAPVLEEDIALTNCALDLIGQARLWLELAGSMEQPVRSADALAYLRDVGAFRNLLLVEQPNGDFGQTLMRQFLFDGWHLAMMEALCGASDPRVAEIAARSSREIVWHFERSSDLVVRLGDGSSESHDRMQQALDGLWHWCGELVTPDGVDHAMHRCGIGPDPVAQGQQWEHRTREILRQATLEPPPSVWSPMGGKRGEHSEHLGHLLAGMQFLVRAYPDATW